MDKLQKIILVSLLSTAGLSWLLSAMQPDMMNIMNTYNPLFIGIFTASWTAGMAAMMFPAIVPMVLLYNKFLTNEKSELSIEIIEPKFYSLKVILFVATYLLIWSVTGLGLLLAWSIPMNSIVTFQETNNLRIIIGSILIVAGLYQFTPLKNKCIGYCESPLSFFMRRWSNGVVGAVRMGAYHGLYCLGCCWPYFLIMVALGWMNLVWMGLFAVIIFAEKIWHRGIWIARCVGIIFVILGALSIMGLTTLHDSMMFMNMESNSAAEMETSQNMNYGVNESKSEMGKNPTMTDGMNM